MREPADGGAGGDHRSDQRSFFRVRARIPMRYRALAPGEFEKIRAEIRTPRHESEGIDPVLGGWMQRLDDKLDLLLSYHDPDQPAPLGSRDARQVEVSGSGMRFEAKDPVEAGEDILLEFQLPGSVPRRVRSIARVIRNLEPHGPEQEREIAVSFRVIDEGDREAIVHFSNVVQRLFLRARSAQGETQ